MIGNIAFSVFPKSRQKRGEPKAATAFCVDCANSQLKHSG